MFALIISRPGSLSAMVCYRAIMALLFYYKSIALDRGCGVSSKYFSYFPMKTLKSTITYVFMEKLKDISLFWLKNMPYIEAFFCQTEFFSDYYFILIHIPVLVYRQLNCPPVL